MMDSVKLELKHEDDPETSAGIILTPIGSSLQVKDDPDASTLNSLPETSTRDDPAAVHPSDASTPHIKDDPDAPPVSLTIRQVWSEHPAMVTMETPTIKKDPDGPSIVMDPRQRMNQDSTMVSVKAEPMDTETETNISENSPGPQETVGRDGTPLSQAPEAGPSKASAAQQAFQVDTSRLAAVEVQDQTSELQQLGITAYDQEEFEQGVMEQVDEALAAEEQARAERFIKKEMKQVTDEVRVVKQNLKDLDKVISMMSPQATKSNEAIKKLQSVRKQKENKLNQLKKLKAKQKKLKSKLQGPQDEGEASSGSEEADSGNDADGVDQSEVMMQALGMSTAKETESERMIRLGEMTPFGTAMFSGDSGTAKGKKDTMTDFQKYLKDQEAKMAKSKKMKKQSMKKSASTVFKASSEESATASKVNKLKRVHSESAVGEQSDLQEPGNRFDVQDKRHYWSGERDYSQWNIRQRRTHARLQHTFSGDGRLSDHEEEEAYGDDEYQPHPDEMIDEDEDFSEAADVTPKKRKKNAFVRKGSKKIKEFGVDDSGEDEAEDDLGSIKARYKPSTKRNQGPLARSRDDGSADTHARRIKQWRKSRLQEKQARINQGEAISNDEDDDEEFDGGLRVPGSIWKNLYRYQKTGVKWLWELHQQDAGGIVGDEMGLGKTIQMIAFLTALRESKLRDKSSHSSYVGLGPTLIVCPTTVMHQWVREFHKWWPPFRVAILHSSGTYSCSVETLVESMRRDKGILITSFSSLVIHQDLLHNYDWHYVILDEGHKIRNPDAQVTLACKQFLTCHRLILSGSPIQNNLKELWSLFDFVFPGKLGTLPDFMAHFSVPILQGGYSNASQVQVQTAYKCACVLRDTINPYLLRRMKADVKVNIDLPEKNEQVLFCRLTDSQREVYKEYLNSKECSMILSGNFMVFPGLITLRKICNHPDISTGGLAQFRGDNMYFGEERQYGYFGRSGKMIVVKSLLSLWKEQGHRVLLFTQSSEMLGILETFVSEQEYAYLRMDGKTPISARQPLITRFNEDTSLFVFLLTTRVGGLGVNLTGANRVIIFDPDWNPSTDMQARERAWRIGQKKQVTIYRLITTGTIEEKIYHRQIFKQFLTNRVLKDPKQRRFFKSNDLFELFTLGTDDARSTETSAIFAGTGSDVIPKKAKLSSESKPADAGPEKKQNRFDEMLKKKQTEELCKESKPRAKAKKKASSTVTGSTKDEEVADQDEPSPDPVNEASEAGSAESSQMDTAEGGASGSIEEDDDEANLLGLSAERLRKMRELARQLSKKISAGGASDSGSLPTQDKKETSDQSAKTSNGDSKHGVHRKKSSHKNKHQEKTSKRKHKKHKKKKDAEFEGQKVAYLDKASTYHPGDEDQKEESSKQTNDDDYVLRNLMKKSGVHSAMQHDRIMMSSDPDYALVEGEAERVAQQAARALKESRSRCMAQPGVPTWTGASGAAGAPMPVKPRFGQKKNSRLLNGAASSKGAPQPTATSPEESEPSPRDQMFDGTLAGNVRTNTGSVGSTLHTMSSSELLEKMRTRKWVSTEDGPPGNVGDGPAPVVAPDNLELLTDIRNHVAFGCSVDGQATTDEVLAHFRPLVPTKLAPKFKAMLKQICDLDKSGGFGIWRLKQEFR